jgi:hypothetical protein
MLPNVPNFKFAPKGFTDGVLRAIDLDSSELRCSRRSTLVDKKREEVRRQVNWDLASESKKVPIP